MNRVLTIGAISEPDRVFAGGLLFLPLDLSS